MSRSSKPQQDDKNTTVRVQYSYGELQEKFAKQEKTKKKVLLGFAATIFLLLGYWATADFVYTKVEGWRNPESQNATKEDFKDVASKRSIEELKAITEQILRQQEEASGLQIDPLSRKTIEELIVALGKASEPEKQAAFDMARNGELDAASEKLANLAERQANSSLIAATTYRQAAAIKPDIYSATPYLKRALELAPDDIEILNELGLNLDATGDWEAAAKIYQRGLKYLGSGESKYANTTELENIIRANYANTLTKLGKEEEAQAILYEALQYFKITNQSGYIANQSVNLAGTYLNSGEYERAVELATEARQIFITNNDETGVFVSTNVIGQAHASLGNADEAKKYLEENVIRTETVLIEHHFRGHFDYGMGLEELKEFEGAIMAFSDAKKVAFDVGHFYNASMTGLMIARNQNELGRTESACEELQEAVKLFERWRNKTSDSSKDSIKAIKGTVAEFQCKDGDQP